MEPYLLQKVIVNVLRKAPYLFAHQRLPHLRCRLSQLTHHHHRRLALGLNHPASNRPLPRTLPLVALAHRLEPLDHRWVSRLASVRGCEGSRRPLPRPPLSPSSLIHLRPLRHLDHPLVQASLLPRIDLRRRSAHPRGLLLRFVPLRPLQHHWGPHRAAASRSSRTRPLLPSPHRSPSSRRRRLSDVGRSPCLRGPVQVPVSLVNTDQLRRLFAAYDCLNSDFRLRNC